MYHCGEEVQRNRPFSLLLLLLFCLSHFRRHSTSFQVIASGREEGGAADCRSSQKPRWRRLMTPANLNTVDLNYRINDALTALSRLSRECHTGKCGVPTDFMLAYLMSLSFLSPSQWAEKISIPNLHGSAKSSSLGYVKSMPLGKDLTRTQLLLENVHIKVHGGVAQISPCMVST